MDVQRELHIIAQVQAGNSAPFAELVALYQDRLFRIVGNMVGFQAAEDVVQEVFLAAYRHIRRYDAGKGAFRTWLYRIARNLALNQLKKRRHLATQTLPPPGAVATPEERILEKEIFRQLDQALATLKFRDRSIFVLAEMEGLPYAEIARIEGVRLGTVKSRLSRSRARLRTLITEYMDRHEE